MYNNPYFNQQRYTMPIPNQQVPTATPAQYIQPLQPQGTLNGKYVDNTDVVKAMDIPLDGSISYFPLTDGSAIVSKQLQNDGTSKVIVYKPVDNNEKDAIRFATIEDLQDAINDIDLSDIQDIQDDIKEIKKQLKELKTKKGKED